MQFDKWQPRILIEQQYQKSLLSLADRFVLVLESVVALDPEDILNALQAYIARNSTVIRAFARSSASRMVTGLLYDGARTWREASREGMRGQIIYEAVQRELNGRLGIRAAQLVDENAKLISTFPETLAEKANRFIWREANKGRRASLIARDLQEQFPNVARSRISLIARTETSKASTALTRARAEGLGLDWYIWRTSKDARVRDSHRLMDRVIVNWNDPPSPEALNDEKSYGTYHAGNTFNCRCYPEPILSLDRVRWPAKVYSNGRIKIMARAEFERLSGWRKAA